MGELAGFKHKVRVNGQAYKAQRITVRDSVGEYDITNGEGVGFSDRIDTTATVEITVTNASYDPDENSFGAPLLIKKRSVVILQIFPDGLDSDPWVVPSFLILEVSHDIDANQGQPVTFRGKNKGLYGDPNDGVT